MTTPKAIGSETGTVRVAIGEVKIIGVDGVARVAQAGDRIFLNETLTTGADGIVQVVLLDGRLLDLGYDSSMVLDAALLAPEAGAAAAAPAALDVAAVQAAIAAGADPSKVAEATAAGAPAAGGLESGGGHTFVTLEQADSRGEVTAGYATRPASIGFPPVELETARVIVAEGNAPPVVESGLARVSEEGLPGALPDTAGTADTTNAALVVGAISISDLDQDLLAVTLSAPQAALSSNGVPLAWSGSGTNTLVGTAGESTIVTITIDASGRYVVRLSGPIDHADTAAEDYELFDVVVNVSDGQAVSTGTLTVAIEDDAPVVNVGGNLLPVLAVDETYLTTDIASADFSGVFTAQFGADGAGGVRYALDVVGGDGRASGLTDTETGQAVVLVTHGDAVEGRVGTAEGALAFTVVLNPATGAVTLDQLRALAHADAATTDEAVSLDTEVLRLVATA
ncbi:MAG: retention module-containing protein, partial [Betaproteobacteria bacterium]